MEQETSAHLCRSFQHYKKGICLPERSGGLSQSEAYQDNGIKCPFGELDKETGEHNPS